MPKEEHCDHLSIGRREKRRRKIRRKRASTALQVFKERGIKASQRGRFGISPEELDRWQR